MSLDRIHSVEVSTPPRVSLLWSEDGSRQDIDLGEWISSGGVLLAPLRDDALFRAVRIGHEGTALVWGDEEGDLAIDGYHLRLLFERQGRRNRRVA